MALLKSVSGIRGTIGGVQGDNLTPADIVSFTSAYAEWLTSQYTNPSVVIGRDGRISGSHVSTLVVETLRAMGVHVVDAGLSTTPSIEMYVPYVKARGGIIITASHNPREWNALKFLNGKGEFISQKDGERILRISESANVCYAELDRHGTYRAVTDAIAYHVDCICRLDLVDVESIRRKHFHIIADCVNSTGALAIPALCEALGCTYTLLNAEVNGEFAHNPEPLEEHLKELCNTVSSSEAVMGIAVDPDVDRLALVDEQGKYFGEEYTLVTVADYILRHTPGPCVSNLSSSMALRDLADSFRQSYGSSKVGEVHVVEEMKRMEAIIGGEGNGGVIYPALHYGRDALVGIALVLSHLATSGRSLSELKSGYPQFAIAKRKIDLPKGVDTSKVFDSLSKKYAQATLDLRDGLKIIMPHSWIHLRTSNTEPVMRIYAEDTTQAQAGALAKEAEKHLSEIVNTLS